MVATAVALTPAAHADTELRVLVLENVGDAAKVVRGVRWWRCRRDDS